MKKKYLLLTTVLVLSLGLTACGKNKEEDIEKPEDEVVQMEGEEEVEGSEEVEEGNEEVEDTEPRDLIEMMEEGEYLPGTDLTIKDYYGDDQELMDLARLEIGQQYAELEVFDKEGNQRLLSESMSEDGYTVYVHSSTGCPFCDEAGVEIDRYLEEGMGKMKFARLYHPRDIKELDESAKDYDRVITEKSTAYDPDGKAFTGVGVPNYFVIDQDGIVVLYKVGRLTAEDLVDIENVLMDHQVE